jgi:thiol:disulfide interchange protein DsbD
MRCHATVVLVREFSTPIAIGLFVLSLGMGAPLLLVGAGISKLPKAGGWMDNVKYVFGILMLAVAIYLLDRIITFSA